MAAAVGSLCGACSAVEAWVDAEPWEMVYRARVRAAATTDTSGGRRGPAARHRLLDARYNKDAA